MKKVIFTHFRQQRKTVDNRKVLGTHFRPESQKRDFSTFGSPKVEMSSSSASGALLAPKTLRNGKVCLKVKKAVLGDWGSKNVPRTLCFSLFCAWSENDDFSTFAHFCAFPLFGRKISFWPPQVVKTAQNAKNPPFCAFLRKWPKKVPQNAKMRFLALKTGFCAQNHFLTEKWEHERKSAKRVKMGFKTPTKSIVYRRVCAMGAKWTPPELKSSHFRKIPHICVQNAFWVLFAVRAHTESEHIKYISFQ